MFGRWRSLSLTSAERELLVVSDDIVAKGRRPMPLGLVGNLLTDKSVYKMAYRDTIKKLCGLNEGLEIKFLADNKFLFVFPSEGEIDRFLSMEPWIFSGAMLVFKPFTGFADSYPKTRFWVRAFDVPPEGMTIDIGTLIGNAVGESIGVEADDSGQCLGPFMRIRVLMDITKPLRRVVHLPVGSAGASVAVALRYERLPDYCYTCGLIGHVARKCETAKFDPNQDHFDYPYGPWLRAEIQVSPMRSSSRSSFWRSSSPGTNLPQEIITEVLLRLPVKYLHKLMCLSKSCHSIISSTQFRKSHLKISSENNIYSHKHLIFVSGDLPTNFYTCLLYPHVDDDHLMDSVSFGCPLSVRSDQIRIVGSCNGLVCVVVYPCNAILLNPATRKYRKLPPVSCDNMFPRCYGFGYDVFNDDYKVICIDLNPPAPYRAQVHIYSLRNDSWTTADWCHGKVFKNPGVFVGGAIHWKVYYRDYSMGNWDLIAQNLTTEKCSTVPLPVPFKGSGLEVELGVSQGLLFAIFHRRSQVDIWVLTEYGVEESWNIMVSLPSDLFPTTCIYNHRIRPKLVSVSENGGILLHFGSNLIMYKSSQHHETYPIADSAELEATTYTESLVSLDSDHMWS
ncbi:F-box/kelch-repeat protein At3g23880-like [Henckelia pumila]|uniref:F-box/kelch-repeat protein At3g23880-like n=1 Tax=Henckelia pumila TaxID=405737 RepID=UPI003C6DC9FD